MSRSRKAAKHIVQRDFRTRSGRGRIRLHVSQHTKVERFRRAEIAAAAATFPRRLRLRVRNCAPLGCNHSSQSSGALRSSGFVHEHARAVLRSKDNRAHGLRRSEFRPQPRHRIPGRRRKAHEPPTSGLRRRGHDAFGSHTGSHLGLEVNNTVHEKSVPLESGAPLRDSNLVFAVLPSRHGRTRRVPVIGDPSVGVRPFEHSLPKRLGKIVVMCPVETHECSASSQDSGAFTHRRIQILGVVQRVDLDREVDPIRRAASGRRRNRGSGRQRKRFRQGSHRRLAESPGARSWDTPRAQERSQRPDATPQRPQDPKSSTEIDSDPGKRTGKQMTLSSAGRAIPCWSARALH